MSDRETKVKYSATANFASLIAQAKLAKAALRDLRTEEAKLNAQSVSGNTRVQASIAKTVASRKTLRDAANQENAAYRKSIDLQSQYSKSTTDTGKAARSAAKDHDTLSKSVTSAKDATKDAAREVDNETKSLGKGSTGLRKFKQDADNAGRSNNTLVRGLRNIQSSFDRFDDWRPRLTPPFVALIPIIAGLISLVNPLVAGFGALASGAYALGSSIAGGIGAAVTGVIPALSTLLGLIASLKVAFSGVGGAFKAYSAMQTANAAGGGGGGAAKVELTQTEQLARAQEKYAEATQDVAFAEQDLDKARKAYLANLKELEKEVARFSVTEERAAANSQLAYEQYQDVLADPASTAGEKMDALASLQEAQENYQDTLDQNAQTLQDYLALQATGIEGDRDVIEAQRAVTNAVYAQRDAEIDLANTQSGANQATSAGATAANAYQQALDKLSPSAKRFVTTIVGWNDAWTALKQNVQEDFFSQIDDDLERIPKLFPAVQSALGKIATAAGRIVDKFIQLTTSDDWVKDITEFGDPAAKAVTSVGNGLLSLLDAFRNITMAAMPFFNMMADGFEASAKSFSDLVATARQDGSLAAWLDKGRVALGKWWQVIKNVGGTLFNYSAASQDFGNWVLDGLVKITDGWEKASEAAKQKGSPFQQYLEDVKPLLSQVKGLFSDFFGWFKREASDPDNIKSFTDIISSIRDNLGPAISGILDMLSDKNIGSKFVDIISKIVGILSTLIDNGALDAFFDTLNTLLGILKGFLDIKGVPEILGAIAPILTTMAALSFVGKFTGLTSLIGWLLKLNSAKGLPDLLTKLTGLTSLSGFVAPTVAVAGAVNQVGEGAQNGYVPDVVTPLANGGLGAGAPIPAPTANDVIARALNGGKPVDQPKTDAYVGNPNPLQDFNPNPHGDGTWTDKDQADLPSNQDIFGKFSSNTTGMFKDFFTKILPDFFTKNVPTWFMSAIGDPVAHWFTTDLPSFFKGVSGWFKSAISDPVVNFFTRSLPGFFGGVGTWMKTSIVDPVVNFFTTTLPSAVGDVGTWLVTYIVNPIVGFFTSTLPSAVGGIGTWLVTYIVNPVVGFFTATLPGAIGGIGTWLYDYIVMPVFNFFTATLPGAVGGIGTWLYNSIVNPVFGFFTQTLPNSIGNIGGWLYDNIVSPVVDFFSYTIPNYLRGINILGWSPFAGLANGGEVIKRASGGSIPGEGPSGQVPGHGNSDTVRTMLTPGEFVVRKAIVDRVGIDNLTKFNAGTMSYAQMLQNAMAEKAKGKPKENGTGGISFFSGGGLVSDDGPSGRFPPPPPGPTFGSGPTSGGGDAPFIAGDLVINYPEPEPASDTLPRTIRKLAYVGGRRSK